MEPRTEVFRNNDLTRTRVMTLMSQRLNINSDTVCFSTPQAILQLMLLSFSSFQKYLCAFSLFGLSMTHYLDEPQKPFTHSATKHINSIFKEPVR